MRLSVLPVKSANTLVPHRKWDIQKVIVLVLSLGWLFMAVVSFEQDRTIANQRDLIRSLLRDSIELNAMKLQRQSAQQ